MNTGSHLTYNDFVITLNIYSEISRTHYLKYQEITMIYVKYANPTCYIE